MEQKAKDPYSMWDYVHIFERSEHHHLVCLKLYCGDDSVLKSTQNKYTSCLNVWNLLDFLPFDWDI